MNMSFEDCCITANKNGYSLVFDVFGVKKDGSVCQNRVPNLSKKLIFGINVLKNNGFQPEVEVLGSSGMCADIRFTRKESYRIFCRMIQVKGMWLVP